MKTQILKVTETNVRWLDLLGSIQSAIGLSIMDPIDRCSIKFSDAAKYLILLNLLDNNYDDPIDVLKILRNTDPYSLNFLHYTFLVVGDDDYVELIQKHSQLKIVCKSTSDTNSGLLSLVSGSLREWYDFINSCLCRDNKILPNKDTILVDMFMLEFMNLGLGDLWFNYQRKYKKDFFLLEKR